MGDIMMKIKKHKRNRFWKRIMARLRFAYFTIVEMEEEEYGSF